MSNVQNIGRRALFLSLVAIPLAIARKPADVPVVTDLARLNMVADRWNAYVRQVQGGVVNLKLWNRLVEGMRGLFT